MVKVADYSNSNLGKIEIAPEIISVCLLYTSDAADE